ncbi:MAG: hypothetical protein PF961_14000 [Planctomycetota bacterium]|jgi:hypothetical protein|nr:hypothetical protein [Planctomycetota bacterium]
MRAVPKTVIILLALALIGCGGGGTGNQIDATSGPGADNGDDTPASDVPPATPPPPVSPPSPSLVVQLPANVATTTDTVDLTATVDNGNGTVSIDWALVSGPVDAVSFNDDTSLTPTVSFPMNGSYVLRVTVTDTTGSANSQIAVTVADPNPFTIEGHVDDATLGVGDVPVRLHWAADGSDLTPLQDSTDSQGDFSIAGLIGDIDRFALTVVGN